MSELEFSNVRTKEMIQNLLHLGEVNITFTKKDGTERLMKCTLAESLIPTDKLPKGTQTKPKTDTVQAVFDLESDGWRSFSWDAVTEVSA